jgi:hypothetical protein
LSIEHSIDECASVSRVRVASVVGRGADKVSIH